jgi:hypothetical protein
MATASPCCLCVGGVNYTMACACNPCGGNSLSMSTVNPNPSACQSVSGGCGGASALSNTLNAIGKWGTVLTASLQGKPVAANKSGVAVGARGATGLSGSLSPNAMLLIVLIIGGLIFLATRH